NLYIAGSNSGLIRLVGPDGIITSLPMPRTDWEPFGLARDPLGNIYAADRRFNRVRKWSPEGSLAVKPVRGQWDLISNPADSGEIWAPLSTRNLPNHLI